MKTKDPILRKYAGRCDACYMRKEVCICALIPEISISTFVTVVMHHRESFKTTNTARLACMALTNSEIYLRGLKDQPLDSSKILKDHYSPILLTLEDSAQVLSKKFLDSLNRPIQLIVPDGNWRQARRVGHREASLKNIPWVKLPAGSLSQYRLRHEHLAEGLSTLEAISRALAIIEYPEIEQKFMSFFLPMVERTIATRPKND